MFGHTGRTEPASLSRLGPLESQLLQIVWSLTETHPEGALARAVHDALGHSLAYTTVNTTLDRLHKKNLLERSLRDRAFVYKARYTRQELEQREAERLIHDLQSSGQLVSCLVDAVAQHDLALLDELEQKIRDKREQLRQEAENGR